MSKKIVAIGGGENGRKKSDGTRYPYELERQDKEIVRLTGKEHPDFLLLAHAQPLERQDEYFQVMTDIYEKMYGFQYNFKAGLGGWESYVWSFSRCQLLV